MSAPLPTAPPAAEGRPIQQPEIATTDEKATAQSIEDVEQDAALKGQEEQGVMVTEEDVSNAFASDLPSYLTSPFQHSKKQH